jgi:hypothetical protein
MTQTQPATTPTGQADRIGGSQVVLTDDQIRTFVQEKLGAASLDGRSVLGDGQAARRPCCRRVTASAWSMIVLG